MLAMGERSGDWKIGDFAGYQQTAARAGHVNDLDAPLSAGERVPVHWLGFDWYCVAVHQGSDIDFHQAMYDYGFPSFVVEGRRLRRIGADRRRRLCQWLPLEGFVFVADLGDAMPCVHALSHGGKPLVRDVVGRVPVERTKPKRDYPPVARPSRLNGAVMQTLFIAHDCGEFIPRNEREANRNWLHVGDTVLIRDGAFDGHEGLVRAIHSGNRIEILAQLFGRETRLNVRLDSVDRIDP